jgi:hypothetical protein
MFKKATRTQSKLRLGLIGPSGSGKTYTALRIARGLGGKIAVIDTERGSASKYAGDVTEFDVLEPETFSPRTFVEAIRAADSAGYDVLIIDSLSHAWIGKGGALEMVDAEAKRARGGAGNSFTAWREVTPEHNAMVEAILQCRAHVIATMRAKTEYVLEEDARGKKVPRKIGVAPVQRDGLEYEFDVVADIDWEHNFVVSKSRCAALDRAVIKNAGEDVAETLKRWLSDGAPQPERVQTAPQLDAFGRLLAEVEAAMGAAALEAAQEAGRKVWGALQPLQREQLMAAVKRAKERVAQRERDAVEAAAAEAALRAQEAVQSAAEPATAGAA